ncbi:MAG: type II secretion system protein GspK [Syntrophobacteraceae bacterium]|nr:type II secretion system protein GspK [Syntrophobacteraceae bacterium]
MGRSAGTPAAEGRAGDRKPKPALRWFAAAAGSRGVVLIAVLWCCAMLMWAGMQISSQTRLLGEDRLHALIESRALYLAIGGCYEALARIDSSRPLQTDLPSDQSWLPDGKPRVVVYKTGIAVVIMESEDQLLNVNTASAAQLTQVLETAGADEQTSQAVAGRIADFVHSQNSQQLQGQASQDFGKSLNHDTGFGGPLTSLDQLLLVPGVTQELFYGYQRGREQWANESRVFDQIAIPARDSLFGQLTVQSGNATTGQGLPGQQGRQGTDLTQNSWTAGGTYRILSFGKSALGSPSVAIRLTIRYQGSGDSPYQILGRKVL